MIYGVAAMGVLAQQCAPTIAVEALIPLVLTESGGDALAINVNKGPRVHARTIVASAALVRRFMARGYTVDVGLAQINSANFARFGMTVEQAFAPCANLWLSAQLLQESYRFASRYYSGSDAISATYSLYNTGTLSRGFINGYVGRVWSAANRLRSSPVPSSTVASSHAITGNGSPSNDASTWMFGQPARPGVEVFE